MTEENGIYITEHDEQAKIIAWAELYQAQYCALGMLHSNQTGAKRSRWEAWQAKEEGMKSGLPDLHLPVASWDLAPPGGMPYHSLWIEMKTKTGRLRPNQKIWIDWLKIYGNRVEVCRSADEAIRVICEHLGIDYEQVKL